jgi:TPR repeat protein
MYEIQNWHSKTASNFTWYQSKAQDGKPDSLFNLGYCFQCRIGTDSNNEKAVELYNQASELGFARAQCSLGNFYASGRGVPKDINRAIELYRKAVEQGYADAQYNLGYYYQHGEGVPKDLKRALELFSKAAKQGSIHAEILEFCSEDVNVQELTDLLKVNSAITLLNLQGL